MTIMEVTKKAKSVVIKPTQESTQYQPSQRPMVELTRLGVTFPNAERRIHCVKRCRSHH